MLRISSASTIVSLDVFTVIVCVATPVPKLSTPATAV
jgi:hypothetical protein